MKKFLSKLLVLTLVIALSGAVSLLAACGESSDGGEVVDYEHTIVFYSSQGDALQTVTQTAIDAFEEKYPGWKVEHTKPGGYDEVRNKITNDFNAGTQPDLAYCYPDHVAQYLKTGKVVNLDKYITSTETVNGNMIGFTEEELADFVPKYYEEGQAKNFSWSDFATLYPGMTDESMLTLPFVRSTELMYYNKTLLSQLKLQPADTWEELWAQCEQISKRFDKVTPLGYDSGANWFITVCKQNGWDYTSPTGEHYLFAGEDQAAWLDMIASYGPQGKEYITTQELINAYTSSLFIKGEDGGLAYCIGSSGGASHQNPGKAFEWGIAPIPGTKKADGTIDRSVISQGPSFVMLTGGNKVTNATEKEKMTFLFMKELLEPTFQAAFSSESGYNPVRQSTSEIASYKKFLDGSETNITAAAVKLAESLKEDFFVSPAFVGSSTARDQAESLLKIVMAKEKTAEQALLEAYKNCSGKSKLQLDKSKTATAE